MTKDLPQIDTTSERALWLGVIEQQVIDATTENKKPTWRSTGKVERERYLNRVQRYAERSNQKAAAQEYLTTESADLNEVCSRADVDPEYLLRKMRILAMFGWDKSKMPRAII